MIVAPVGLQPAAVLSPLLSPPVQPRDGDRVVLLASGQQASPARVSSIDPARRIHAELERQGFPPEIVEAQNGADTTSWLDALSSYLDDRETWVLANGGTTQWLLALLDRLRRRGKPATIAVSRDRRGALCNLHGEPAGEFAVRGLGCGRLLDLLGRSLADFIGSEHRPTIEVEERFGFLFARVDAQGWHTKRGLPLTEEYRRLLLDWRRLQGLGLDRRRVTLANLHPSLQKRAREDGFVVEAEGGTIDGWPGTLDADTDLFALPEKDRGEDRPARSSCGLRTWQGRPLAVVMGPQPSTTLRAIWCHRPARLLVLYDHTQPETTGNARRLLRSPLGCVKIECRSFREPGAFGGWAGEAEAVDVNLTPGDTLSTLVLELEAARRPGRWQRWTLRDNVAQPCEGNVGSSEPGEPVPVATWVDLHAPVDSGRTHTPLPQGGHELLDRMSSNLFEWLTSQRRAPEKLDELWKRKVAPRLADLARLHWPGSRSRST